MKVGIVRPTSPDPSITSDLIAPAELVFAATRPAFHYQYARLEGVLASPGESRETTVQTASVELHWSPGDRFAFEYEPAWTWYSSEAFEDNVSHDARARAQFQFGDWRTALAHRYYRAATPLIETGRQTAQDINITSVQAWRVFGPRLSFDVGLQQQLRSAEEFEGIREWSGDGWIHYRFSSAFTSSIGLSAGYTNLEEGPDMSYQQYRARIRWQPRESIRLDLRGGAETRRVSGAASTNFDNPVFGGTIDYRLFDHTRLSFVGDKRVTTSLMQSQLSRSTLWRIGLGQRLLERFHLNLNWLHREMKFDPVMESSTPSRQDEGNGVQARLITSIRSRGTISLAYQRTRNRSNLSDFDFTATQVGIELSVRY